MKNRQRPGGQDKIINVLSSLIYAGILLVVLSRPLISGLTYQWSNSYIQIILLFLSFPLLLALLRRQSIAILQTSLIAPFIVFLLVLVISYCISIEAASSLEQLYHFISYFLFYCLVVYSLRAGNSRQVFQYGFSLFLVLLIIASILFLKRLFGIGAALRIICPAAVLLALLALFQLKEETTSNLLVFKSMVLVLLFSALVVSCYGIHQYFFGLEKAREIVKLYYQNEFTPQFIARLETDKAFSTFVYPPALAGFLIIIIPLGIGYLSGEKQWTKRVVPALTVLLSLICLYYTFSKGGWLSLLITGTLALCIKIKSRYMKRYRFLLLAIIPLILMSLIVPEVRGKLSDLTEAGFLQGFITSFKVRVEYWQAAWAMFKDYPLFGSGIGTFGALYFKYKLPLAEGTQMAHNNYLQMLTETGVIGFSAYLYLWTSFLINGWKGIFRIREKNKRRLLTGCYFGVVAFLIHGLVDFDLYVPGIIVTVWLLAAFVTGSISPEDIELKKKKEKAKRTGSFCIYAFAGAAFLCQIMLLSLVCKPLFGERYYQLGERLIHSGKLTRDAGRTKSGVEYLKTAINCYPINSLYYFRLGQVYEEWFRFGLGAQWRENAVENYQRAVTLSPSRDIYHSKLGRFYWYINDRDKAKEEFEQACNWYPTKPRYQINLGYAYKEMGREKEAEIVLRRVSSLLESRVENWQQGEDYFLLGQAYQLLGREDDARRSWQRAVEIDPGLQEKVEKLINYKKNS